MITYTIEDNKLIFKVADSSAFAEFIEECPDIYTDYAFLDSIEHLLRNGLHQVLPETIGALTDSLLFSFTLLDEESVHYDEPVVVYWDPDYAIRSPLQDLIETGETIFIS